MSRSRLNELRWAVEVRHGNFGGFEPMAAFNVERVAWRYAAECQYANPHNEYQVVERTSRGWSILPNDTDQRFANVLERGRNIRRAEAERNCPGHVARNDDAKRCRHCGTHIAELAA